MCDRDAGDGPDASLGLLRCVSGDPMLASLSLRALLWRSMSASSRPPARQPSIKGDWQCEHTTHMMHTSCLPCSFMRLVQTTSNDHADGVLCWQLSKGAPVVVSRSCRGSNSIDAWIWHSSMTNVTKDSKPRQPLLSSKNEGKQSMTSSADR